jgi:hypothetical protein
MIKIMKQLLKLIETSEIVLKSLLILYNKEVSADNSNEHVDYTYTSGLITKIIE